MKEEEPKQPITEEFIVTSLAQAESVQELENLALLIQSPNIKISKFKEAIIQLFCSKSQQIRMSSDIYNKTMKKLGSKAEIFFQSDDPPRVSDN